MRDNNLLITTLKFLKNGKRRKRDLLPKIIFQGVWKNGGKRLRQDYQPALTGDILRSTGKSVSDVGNPYPIHHTHQLQQFQRGKAYRQ